MASTRTRVGTCLACGKPQVLTRDHVIPRSILRKHGLSNPLEGVNIQHLCLVCNQSKAIAMVDYRCHQRHERLQRWLAEVGLDLDVLHVPKREVA
jgi:5-methylcytosine-specific restriction endonuclease McrA